VGLVADLFDSETGEAIEPGDCPNCTQLRGTIRALEGERDDLEKELRGKRRHVSALKNAIEKQAHKVRDAQVIEDIAQYWRDTCGHPRAAVSVDGIRAEAVWQRLTQEPRACTPDEIKRAIYGCSLFPYVGQGGRVRAGTPKQRFDDLELICRDEKRIEGFIELADREDERKRAGEGEPEW
jgi:hypothetical protein